MKRRLKAMQVRATRPDQSSDPSESLDLQPAQRHQTEASAQKAPDNGSAPGPRGHDFGLVPIYPVRQMDAKGAAEQAVGRVAESGFRGPAGDFPFREQIEASFGRPIQAQAHADHNAADACDAFHAKAFTSAGHVAFATGSPTLRTAAHEAAHVLQQAGGVQLRRQVGDPGDRYETNADLAAELAVQGRSAAHLFGAAPQTFSTAPSRSAPVQLQDVDREENRTTRTERAHEDDRRRGRPEGGRERRDRRSDPFADFESDWAGRAILERYLSGEGDWDIWESEHWKSYMMRSEVLREQLKEKLEEIAKPFEPLPDGMTLPFYKTFRAEVENGEGIIGYQYLHGTNKDVGGFVMWGEAKVRKTIGSCNVHGPDTPSRTTLIMDVSYRWNDIIDPNPKYGTDTVKSWIAEILTFGQAESYRISIGWKERCTVTFEDAGKIKISGYPGP